MLVKEIRMPVIAFFALRDNHFSKPHTGLWKLLKSVYAANNANIKETIVVSSLGGIIDSTTNKANSSLDRAFAYNIGVPFLAPDEFLKGINLKYRWDTAIVSPEIREIYCDEMDSQPAPDVFQELIDMNLPESFIILIMGAPRTGKSTFVKEFCRKWRGHKINKSNCLKVIDTKKELKKLGKYLEDRMHIIVDGNCNSALDREKIIPYIDYKRHKVIIVHVMSGRLSEVLNHHAVESATNDIICLRPKRDYHIYKGTSQIPSYEEIKEFKLYEYYPKIKRYDSIMKYMYC